MHDISRDIVIGMTCHHFFGHVVSMLSRVGHQCFVILLMLSRLGQHVVQKCHPATFSDNITCRPTTCCRLRVNAFPLTFTTCRAIWAKNYDNFEAKWPKMLCCLANFSNFWSSFRDVISSRKQMLSEMSCRLDIVGNMSLEMSCRLGIVIHMSKMSCHLDVVDNIECHLASNCQNLCRASLQLTSMPNFVIHG